MLWPHRTYQQQREADRAFGHPLPARTFLLTQHFVFSSSLHPQATALKTTLVSGGIW